MYGLIHRVMHDRFHHVAFGDEFLMDARTAENA